MMAGIPVHKTGNAINAAKSMLGSTQGAAAPRNPLKALKPGYRMAGGLVGMIVGGGLGNAIAAQAKKKQNSGWGIAAQILIVLGGIRTVLEFFKVLAS